MREVALYVEGGGDSTHQRAQLRQGFDGLFRDIKAKARENASSFKIVCCGDRRSTFEKFLQARKHNPQACNILLVDSEEAVAKNVGGGVKVRVAHLQRRDDWDFAGVPAETVHLMIQCMETWICADKVALENYYGRGFSVHMLPQRVDLEEEPKGDVQAKLANAARGSQKGEYRKIRDASKLLGLIDPTSVGKRCKHFVIALEFLGAQV